MTDVQHAPGTFCWAELSTSDADGAKKFYTALMGWDIHDDPIPGGGTYTMILMEGGNVGALYGLTAEMKDAGVPPSWLSYVTVASAAEAAKKARELGGTVVKDAFDVFDIGAMAVLQDPTGATFAVWQPKKHTGTSFTDGRPGSLCWNELATRDVGKARDFYAGLFGWRPEIMEVASGPYTLFMNRDDRAGGLLQMTEEWGEIPPHWMVYFAVADCDATAAKAGELGGEARVPPTDIPPVGRFAVLQDPQGAVFSVIKLTSPGA